MYLLDTNVCIKILNNSSETIRTRLKEENPGNITISSVVKAELYYGARNSQRVEENLLTLRRFFEPLNTAPFDDLCAEQSGIIRAELKTLGTPIGTLDILIAATARAKDFVLVTHNLKEFSRVPGIRIEDWEV